MRRFRYYYMNQFVILHKKTEKHELIYEVSWTNPCNTSESPLHFISFLTVRMRSSLSSWSSSLAQSHIFYSIFFLFLLFFFQLIFHIMNHFFSRFLPPGSRYLLSMRVRISSRANTGTILFLKVCNAQKMFVSQMAIQRIPIILPDPDWNIFQVSGTRSTPSSSSPH